jgi:N-acetylglucosaminyl-diphospho-decaprenol L-rhamnosyltransferase
VDVKMPAVELSYCVVNTNGRDFLLRCLAAIPATHPPGVDHEIIVLDNASDDGSAEAVRERFPDVQLIVRDRRAGAAENNNVVLRAAAGRFCMLLDEDAELLDGATEALLDALRSDPTSAVAGAQLYYPGGRGIGCAWRLPGVGSSIAEAFFLDRWLTVQVAKRTREVGWAQSAAMLIRSEAAEQVNYLDSGFFLYFDEVDFQKRLHDAGWRILHVPAARAIHNQQIATDQAAGDRRVVEFHRRWDMYMRKHHSALEAAVVRVLVAWKYSVRALFAVLMPGRRPRRFLLHARQSLRPNRGEGMRERAEAHNARRAMTG